MHFARVNPVDWKFRAGFLKDWMPLQLPPFPGSTFPAPLRTSARCEVPEKGQKVFGIARGRMPNMPCISGDVVAKPDNLGDELAATFPSGPLTAGRPLRTRESARERHWSSWGAGGVGIFAVQFARAKGARVIATASSETWISCAHSVRKKWWITAPGH